MGASGKDASLRILRGLVSELRLINQKSNVRDMAAYQHVIEQFRRFQMTDAKLCRGREEMLHLGQVYLCYLRSTRRRKELQDEYRGKGERSLEDAARTVGLRLPKQYEDGGGTGTTSPTLDKDK